MQVGCQDGHADRASRAYHVRAKERTTSDPARMPGPVLGAYIGRDREAVPAHCSCGEQILASLDLERPRERTVLQSRLRAILPGDHDTVSVFVRPSSPRLRRLPEAGEGVPTG